MYIYVLHAEEGQRRRRRIPRKKYGEVAGLVGRWIRLYSREYEECHRYHVGVSLLPVALFGDCARACEAGEGGGM